MMNTSLQMERGQPMPRTIDEHRPTRRSSTAKFQSYRETSREETVFTLKIKSQKASELSSQHWKPQDA